MADRAATIRNAASGSHDVIVIGGGINGAGIARDLAGRGLRVLLLERHDWGFGTTWRSTKLIHGGLRYLEHGELGLVFESLRERAVLLRTAPHLVRPLPFLLPVFEGSRRGRLTLRAGLTVYDLLATGGGLPRHRTLSASEVARAEPRLRRDGLRGGFGYWDAQVALPERLCLENVLRASDHGATVLNHLAVTSLLSTRKGRVAGVTGVDQITGVTAEFRAPLAVNAAGPWVDAVLSGRDLRRRIGGSRGTHLVVRFPDGGPRRAIYAEAARDGRPFFIIPWRGVHLVGTTDVRVTDPQDSLPSDDEVDYLIEATKGVLGGTCLQPEDVWYAYGGIRPLPATKHGKEGAITRRHHIIDHRREGIDGLFSVVGGKLSTYRSLAAEAGERIAARIGNGRRSRTGDEPLVPGDWRPDAGNVEERRLWRLYGPRAISVLDMQRRDPALAERLCPHTLDTVAQVHHAMLAEGALTVGDVLLRRTPSGWGPCLGLDAAPRVAAILVEHAAGPFGTSPIVAAYEEETRTTFRRVAGVCRFA